MMRTACLVDFRSLRFVVLCLVGSLAFAQAPKSADWKAVDEAMGRSGADQPDGTHKYSMPRKDLSVTVNGTAIKAGLALGSWAAFKREGGNTTVMGDLVLTEDEVAPVMAKLQEGNVMITALHNHLLHERPRVMYMHIHGMGDAVKLAQAIHSALGETKTPPPDTTAPAQASSQALDLDTAAIEQALGAKGKNNGGIFQFSIPRKETIAVEGMTVPASMGVATAINFQPTGGGKAAITGDFVLVATEVNPVISALRHNNIVVTALHSHMLEEQPRLFFMHFWANDDAGKLARGLHEALEKTNSEAGH